MAVSTLHCKSWGQFWGCKVGGTIVNLTGSGLILRNPGNADLAVAAGATAFQFAGTIPGGSTYGVTLAQPANGQQCLVANASGIAEKDVSNIAITCYASASFDTTFAAGGAKVVTNIAGLVTAFDSAMGLALDSADRILITGQSQNTTPATVMIVCRFLTDGNLDSTFATASVTPGCVTLLNGTSSIGYGIAFDSTNNLVYATGSNGTNSMLTARFLANGILDTSFNGTGFVLHALGVPTGEGRSVAIDSAGRPVITGRVNCAATCDWIVWRYSAGGLLDTSFNGTGYVQTAGGYATAYDLFLQSGGKILVTGSISSTMSLRRYNADGSLDTSFNGSGIYSFPIGAYTTVAGYAFAQNSFGNIVITGEADVSASNADMAIWKFSAAGVPDATFNGSGVVTHNNAAAGATNPNDVGTSVAVDNFGRILVGGYSCNNSGFGTCAAPDYEGYSIVVWRYNADGTPDTTFNAGSHFKIVDNGIFAQNIYTTRVGLKLDMQGRIVLSGSRDDDAVSSGDGQNLRIYRLYN